MHASVRSLSSRWLGASAFAFALSSFATSARADDVWTDPFPGVRHLHRTTSDQNINVLRVDLCAAGVGFRSTKPDEKKRTPPSFAELVGAQAAVNGDFFKADFTLERGIAVGDGVAWAPSATPEDETVGQLAFGDDRVELIKDSVLQKVEPWMKNVVGGRPTLLVDGKVRDFSIHPNLCQKNPRTVVGLSQGKKILFIAVVDGREETHVGMTCSELADFMKDLGAENAMALDGGGSSAMWVQGEGVVSKPSDGSPRVVANHLAVYAKGQGKPSACEVPPTGALTVTCAEGITGWVKNAAEPVELEVTFDVLPGASPARVHSLTATTDRADTCDDAGTCGRGFESVIPTDLQDGKPHTAWLSFKGRPADVLGTSASFTCGTAPTSNNPPPLAAKPQKEEPAARPEAAEQDGCQTAPSGNELITTTGLVLGVGLVLERMRRSRTRG